MRNRATVAVGLIVARRESIRRVLAFSRPFCGRGLEQIGLGRAFGLLHFPYDALFQGLIAARAQWVLFRLAWWPEAPAIRTDPDEAAESSDSAMKTTLLPTDAFAIGFRHHCVFNLCVVSLSPRRALFIRSPRRPTFPAGFRRDCLLMKGRRCLEPRERYFLIFVPGRA